MFMGHSRHGWKKNVTFCLLRILVYSTLDMMKDNHDASFLLSFTEEGNATINRTSPAVSVCRNMIQNEIELEPLTLASASS